jgi:hypothetical protein
MNAGIRATLAAAAGIAAFAGFMSGKHEPSISTDPPPKTEQPVIPAGVRAAQDVEDQYHTLVRTDAKLIELCVQAGTVQQVYVNISDDAQIKRWDYIREMACSGWQEYRLSEVMAIKRDSPAHVREALTTIRADALPQ